MIEIAISGRGGQGVVKAAHLLAIAAFLSGYEVQAFPMFGVERRGAPLHAFVRLDKKPIRTRTQISKADYTIVLDKTLASSANGKETIINSRKKMPNSFDAESIAMRIFPQAVNTAMIAAFAFFTKLVSKESLVKACIEVFDAEAAQKNIKMILEAYSALEHPGK